MADTEKQRRQREREAQAREEREREEFRRKEEKRRIQRHHDDEMRRWTDMAVKIQQEKRAKEIAEAEAKRIELLKKLEQKQKEQEQE
jgi:hypothetical protein